MSSPTASTEFLSAILDANPSMMFVVDADVLVLHSNRAAHKFLDREPTALLHRRGGDIFNCIHNGETAEGCGHARACRDCAIRTAVNMAVAGESVFRSRATLEMGEPSTPVQFYALITAVPFQYDGRQLVLLTIEDISELAELWRVIPICSQCKKIRTDDQYWTELENFFRSHWDLRFTHGYCPDCMAAVLDEARRRKSERPD